jgi:hypothetical protein
MMGLLTGTLYHHEPVHQSVIGIASALAQRVVLATTLSSSIEQNQDRTGPG